MGIFQFLIGCMDQAVVATVGNALGEVIFVVSNQVLFGQVAAQAMLYNIFVFHYVGKMIFDVLPGKHKAHILDMG